MLLIIYVYNSKWTQFLDILNWIKKKTGTHKYIYLKKEKKAIISARMNEFSLYQTMCDEDQNFYPINELPVE